MNEPLTIITNNCLGEKLYLEFNKQFNSPFINLFINFDDFVKLIANLKKYVSLNLEFSEEILCITRYNQKYPRAFLGDIEIHFFDYKNKEEAQESWTRRVKRINYKNLVVIGCENQNFNLDLAKQFLNLSYKKLLVVENKKIFDELKGSSDVLRADTLEMKRLTKQVRDTEFINEIMKNNVVTKQKRLLTVIVTTYNLNKNDGVNESPIINQTIDSCINQTLDKSKFEVIVIDDCSTDGTFEVLKEYERQYSNVKVFQTITNSGGAGKPRNIGLAMASSDFVMFLDGDDYFGKEAFRKIENHIKENSFDLAYLKRFSMGKRGVPRGSAHGNSLVMKNSSILGHWMYAENAPGIKVVRRKLLAENTIIFDETMPWGEDKVFGLQLLVIPNLKTIILNDYEYYYWRDSIEGQGLTSKKWSKKEYHKHAYTIHNFLSGKILLEPRNIYLKKLWYKFFSYTFRTLPMIDEELISNIIHTARFDIDFSQFDIEVRNKAILCGYYGLTFLENEIIGKKQIFAPGKVKINFEKNETLWQEVEYFPALNLSLKNTFIINNYELDSKFLKITLKLMENYSEGAYKYLKMLSQTVIDGQVIEKYFNSYLVDDVLVFEIDYHKILEPHGNIGWWKLYVEFDEKRYRISQSDFAEVDGMNKIENAWFLNIHPQGWIDLHHKK